MLAFALGGLLKGTIGIGMPFIAVPLLTYFMPVPKAVALMVLPILVSNVYQMLWGGDLRGMLRRFWPLLISLFLGILIGSRLLVSIADRTAYLVLGAMLLTFVGTNLIGRMPYVSSRQEAWMGPAVGGLSGLLGGLSSFFGPPLILYFSVLRLGKEHFVQTVAAAFIVGTVPLSISLAVLDVLGPEELALSAAGCVPVAISVILGQRVRRVLPERAFRNFVLLFLALVGSSMLHRALLS